MSKLSVDDALTKVEKVTEVPIQQYLGELAINKIKNDEQIVENTNGYESAKTRWANRTVFLENEEVNILNDLQAVLRNKKTVIKALLKKENIPLNNTLAKAFPKEFKPIKIETPIQSITTDDGFVCMNVIQKADEEGKIHKIDCMESFENQADLDSHREKHRKNKELV